MPKRNQISKKKIGVLMGGPSSEREISFKSGRAVEEALRRSGLNVVAIDVDKDIEERLKGEGVEVAFIALHGRYGEDGTIQALLESLAIPYTGSGVEASRMAMDKVASKEVFLRDEIPTPDFYVLKKEKKEDMVISQLPCHSTIRIPVVIKPAREGSTIGVSIVKEAQDFLPALDKAFQYDDKILVEEYIEGREVTVSILNGSPLPIIEIVPEHEFFDFQAKYIDGLTEFKVPAPLTAQLYGRTQKIALQAHRALGCRGMSRVDMKVSREGRPYVFEVNTIPGLTSISLLPKAAEAAGVSFPQLCRKLIEIALRENTNQREHRRTQKIKIPLTLPSPPRGEGRVRGLKGKAG